MFKWLVKKLQRIPTVIAKSRKNLTPNPTEDRLTRDLDQNLSQISNALSQSPDLVIRRFTICLRKGLQAAVVFIDGLIDQTVINDHILRPLMVDTVKIRDTKVVSENDLILIEDHLVTVNGLARNSDLQEVLRAILTGDTVLLIQGFTEALQIYSKGWEKRSIIEPATELIVKGPRDGFVENLRTNTAMLRRKIGHPNLTLEALRLGRKTRTDVCIAFIRGLAREELVAEVRKRIRRIDIDAILGSGTIEQFIEDAPFALFSTVGFTERPDVAAARLLEGRVAIVIDGTPIVDTVPMLFIESFQSPDDYAFRTFYASLIRWIRFLAFGLSILLPALFVALTSFHQELIPTHLLITMAASMDATPFPIVIEVVGMGIVFEVLREAGIRLPRPFGQAVSIVGGLVIGETAVAAGLIGEPTVIIIAFTAITSFVVPFQAEVGTLLRLGLTILAGIFGLFGILVGFLAILIHLAALRSFGIPYLSPIAPLIPDELKDVLIRAPLWAMRTRPRSLEPQDSVRQKSGLRPGPPDENEE